MLSVVNCTAPRGKAFSLHRRETLEHLFVECENRLHASPKHVQVYGNRCVDKWSLFVYRKISADFVAKAPTSRRLFTSDMTRLNVLSSVAINPFRPARRKVPFLSSALELPSPRVIARSPAFGHQLTPSPKPRIAIPPGSLLKILYRRQRIAPHEQDRTDFHPTPFSFHFICNVQ